MTKQAPQINLVVGTRLGRDEFFASSLLGRTLVRQASLTRVHLFLENSRGLPAIYNEAIRAGGVNKNQIYVFAHDDIMIADLFWEERIIAALDEFDVVGVAGTTIRHSKQPSWIFKSFDPSTNMLAREDLANLSGCVGHGETYPPRNVSRYGPVPQRVQLLDGVLLAVRGAVLKEHGLSFDERFDFHFYDLDFCRQAGAHGLTCGTVAVSLVHKSGGNFGSEAWRSGYEKYIEKWGD